MKYKTLINELEYIVSQNIHVIILDTPDLLDEHLIELMFFINKKHNNKLRRYFI